MRKLFALVCFLTLGMLAVAHADQVPDGATPNGMNYTLIQSSGQVFTGGGTLYQLFPSTGNGLSTSFVQVIDTVVVAGHTFSQFPPTTYVTPQIQLLPSTATFNSNMAMPNFQPYGVRIKKGLFIYNSDTSVSSPVGVYWKK